MVFITIRYTDGTGAMTQCDAQTCAQAVDALKAFFLSNADKARSEGGAPVERISAINTANLGDVYAVDFKGAATCA